MDQKNAPQMLLVCCEGRTEEQYFLILQDIFRINAISIQIIPNIGQQHEKLVDSAITRRLETMSDAGIFESEDDIELWIVCDRDRYQGRFTKLSDYAKNKNVNVAFSSPQFENYILQHFGGPNKSIQKGKALEDGITKAMLKYGLTSIYTKGDLEWLRDIVDQKHSVIATAIKNANIFSTHTKEPFFTVQHLADRLLSYSESDL